ncbi:hypothetical protein [Chitinophaga defluvii]|uniref:Uncharacterized protein n=1 Tax=Chitinophaga defluvii TaxID=3163343 RepID=A0ABV2T111_9BACT
MTLRVKLLFLVILPIHTIFAQSVQKIVKDLDGDLKKDTIYIDSDLDKLFCILSTNKYKPVESLKIQILNFGNMLAPTKNGFEFWNDYGRSGFINEFKYNPKTKKVQLIRITRTDYDISYTDFGEKVRNGSGKSSINLLTNKYVGNFYDVHNGKLRKLPTIYAEMIIPETNIEDFNDGLYFDYEKRCVALYEKRKKETR